MGFEQERKQHSGDQLVHEVVTAVADARGIDPLDMEERLFDVVDPDALGNLFSSRPDGTPRLGGQVTFQLARCDVTVDGDGRISVALSEDAE